MNFAIGRAPALNVVIIALLALIRPAAAEDAGAFYKDKTLRVIVGSAPGGGYDAYARIISEHLRQHIPGNTTVVVQPSDVIARVKPILEQTSQ